MSFLAASHIVSLFFLTVLFRVVAPDTIMHAFIRGGTVTSGPFDEIAPMDVQATLWNNMACGYDGVCKSKSMRYECPSAMFECTKCRCDLDCAKYRDCCPDADSWTMQNDVPRGSVVSAVQYTCVSPVFKDGRPSNYVWYNMVATCPTSPGTESLKQHCENPDKKDILANIPVYSTQTNRTYRNMKCALCHGDIDSDLLIPWKIKITCKGYVDYSRVSTQRDFYTEALSNVNCGINMEAPMDGITRECLGWADDVISQCNVTGMYKEHHEGEYAVLQKACSSFQQAVISETTFRIYRNVFCAACNGLRIQREASNKPPCMPPLRPDLKPPYSAPLSVLFDFNPKVLQADPDMRVTEIGCQDNNVYDDYHVSI